MNTQKISFPPEFVAIQVRQPINFKFRLEVRVISGSKSRFLGFWSEKKSKFGTEHIISNNVEVLSNDFMLYRIMNLRNTDIKENTNSKSRMSLKTIILVSLCLQNAGYTLIRKYSTVTEKVSSKEILLVAEIMKMIIAVYFTG